MHKELYKEAHNTTQHQQQQQPQASALDYKLNTHVQPMLLDCIGSQDSV